MREVVGDLLFLAFCEYIINVRPGLCFNFEALFLLNCLVQIPVRASPFAVLGGCKNLSVCVALSFYLGSLRITASSSNRAVLFMLNIFFGDGNLFYF